MSGALDYVIVVPSRHREGNMRRLLSLLPEARICVDEREAKAYAPKVPKEQLWLHPPLSGGPVRNWIIDNTPEPILVICDDDFQGVQITMGGRFITDADTIREIVENAMRCCVDLDLTCFCFSRSLNDLMIRPEFTPIKTVYPAYGLFGLLGRARFRHVDPELFPRADLDWSLRTLLEDRIVYCDQRFYFDFGPSFGSSGGSSGLLSGGNFERITRGLKQRWGKHISFTASNFSKGGEDTEKAQVTGSIRVRRSAANVQR